jgi:RNA polymerase sigma factor (sigma-70 family)
VSRASRTARAERGRRRALPPFQAFFEEHRSAVLGFLIATVGPGDADDCFQETFLSALRAYPSLRDGSNLRGWVLTIAHHKAIDTHRARTRRPAPSPEPPDRGEVDPALEDVTDGTSAAWRAAASLPPRQRAAIAHRFVADLRYRDIGAIMGSSEAAARRNVHEGLEKLRRELRA